MIIRSPLKSLILILASVKAGIKTISGLNALPKVTQSFLCLNKITVNTWRLVLLSCQLEDKFSFPPSSSTVNFLKYMCCLYLLYSCMCGKLAEHSRILALHFN